jgi:hypothetical protein
MPAAARRSASRSTNIAPVITAHLTREAVLATMFLEMIGTSFRNIYLPGKTGQFHKRHGLPPQVIYLTSPFLSYNNSRYPFEEGGPLIFFHSFSSAKD